MSVMMQQMQELVAQLNQYAYDYYVLDNPRISDGEYDALYDKLLLMEKEQGIDRFPLQKIGRMIIMKTRCEKKEAPPCEEPAGHLLYCRGHVSAPQPLSSPRP